MQTVASLAVSLKPFGSWPTVVRERWRCPLSPDEHR
jgi:hypothetical protein